MGVELPQLPIQPHDLRQRPHDLALALPLRRAGHRRYPLRHSRHVAVGGHLLFRSGPPHRKSPLVQRHLQCRLLPGSARRGFVWRTHPARGSALRWQNPAGAHRPKLPGRLRPCERKIPLLGYPRPWIHLRGSRRRVRDGGSPRLAGRPGHPAGRGGFVGVRWHRVLRIA